MLAIQNGCSNPVRISSKRWEKDKVAPVSVWRGRPRPRSAAQPIANVMGGPSRNADNFIPASLTGRNGKGRSRHLQKFGEEFNAGVVSSTVDWRRGQRDLE